MKNEIGIRMVKTNKEGFEVERRNENQIIGWIFKGDYKDGLDIGDKIGVRVNRRNNEILISYCKEEV
tara:strand:+ start:183 stop:383 length:201 start_codon:yes stop_codon:yes gene_type:complete